MKQMLLSCQTDCWVQIDVGEDTKVTVGLKGTALKKQRYFVSSLSVQYHDPTEKERRIGFRTCVRREITFVQA